MGALRTAHLGLAAGCAIAVLSRCPDAAAQTDAAVREAAVREATVRFREGLHFHDLGQEEEARLKFAQAYAVLRTPNILFNLARSEQLTGHWLDAIRHYRSYARDADPKITKQDRDTATQHIRELSVRVGHVRIEAPVGAVVLVDGAEQGEAPFAEPLDVEAGKHQIVARLGEASKAADVTASAGETANVALSIDAGSVANPPPGPPTGAPTPPPGTHAPPPPPPSRAAEVATVVALSAGAVVGIAVGAAFVAEASKESNDIKSDQAQGNGSSCYQSTSARCADLASATSAHRTDVDVAVVSFAAGGALALGGLAAFLFWPRPGEGRGAWLVPAVTPTGWGVQVMGRF